MKKLASVLISIIMLVLINGLAIAGTPSFDNNDVTSQTSSYQFLEAVLRGETIATSTKTINIYSIAGYSRFAIHNVDASAGTPTFLFESVDQDGNVVSTASMTEGVDITNIDGANCNINIINGEAAPITVTCSILIGD